MPGEYVDVKKFKKVVLLYNRNSGKQLFASMMAKVNETYKLVKELVGPKNRISAFLGPTNSFTSL